MPFKNQHFGRHRILGRIKASRLREASGPPLLLMPVKMPADLA
jgi:hypothetical protein